MKDVEVGVNWRFQTGLPFSPFAENSDLVQSWDVNGRGLPDFSRLNTQRTNFANGIDMRIDKKWYFEKWSLNVYFDVENLTGNSVGIPALILDRNPEGERVIINPTAPIAEQRYQLKTIDNAVGTVLPSLGLMVEL